MPLMQAVADALEVWRDAERLLEQLPAGSREWVAVSEVLGDARDLYALLTTHTGFDSDEIESARATIRRVRETLFRYRPLADARESKPPTAS